MYALTADRLRSRQHRATLDMAQERRAMAESFPESVLPWQVSAGDELQALFADPEPVVEAALALAETRQWHVGIGVGAADEPLPAVVAEANGPCLIRARQAVETARKSTCRTAVRAPRWATKAGRDADSLLALLSVLRQRRTEAAREAAGFADQGLTQEQISTRLGIDQSSVSRRLRTALWQEESEARQVLIDLLEIAHQRALDGDQDGDL